MSESNLFDFHELRQDFSPPIQEMKTVSGWNVRETVFDPLPASYNLPVNSIQRKVNVNFIHLAIQIST